MLRNVFFKSLRDQRRALLWWFIGLLVLGIYMMIIYPSIATPEMTQMFENLPPAVRALMGATVSFATPIGYVNAEYYSLMVPLLFMIFTIIFGSGAIAGEEEQGTLDWVLSHPLARWHFVLEKFLAMVVVTALLGLFVWLSLWVGALLADIDLDMGRVAAGTASAVLMGLVFGSLALALGGLRSGRGFGAGVAVVVALVSYFTNTFANLVDQLKDINRLNPYYYYIASNPLVNGIDLGHAAVLVALSVVLLLIALFSFQRRDLAA